ncbi:hypothetical protein HZC21_04075, partial [Candidatus Peregrinibacteria bacterium]|nr:hypothetical protein [Candidatus Peregrinibacteria bacterium]
MDNLIKTSKRFLYILLITAAISVTGFSLPPLILLILPLGLIVGVAAAFFALRAPFKVEALRKQGELVYVLGIKRWLLFTPLVASIVFVIAAILFNQLPSTPYCILNYADFTTFATKLSWAKYIAIAVGISGLAILAVSLFISLILFISSRKKHQEDKV